MRVQDSVWQGCGGYWLPLFIREYVLPLGHEAWQGFLRQGRGLVTCRVAVTQAATVDWGRTPVHYTLDFNPQAQVGEHLQALQLEPELVSGGLTAVATYDPTQDLVLLLLGDGQTTLTLLRRLAVPPPQCYRQVRNRWAEFALVPDDSGI
ncbi:MAG: hypothetical protein ACFCVD_08505 [Nodosilinea sp.]